MMLFSRRRRGYTLVELILAAALLAMVIGVIWRIYVTGWWFFESQKKKAEILHDVRRVLLFFDRDLREALVGVTGHSFQISSDRIIFERPTAAYEGEAGGVAAFETVTYTLTRSGETIKLVREPAVFQSTGETVLMQTKKSKAGDGVITVGLISSGEVDDLTVRTEFRGYDDGYDPFVADSFPSNSEKESYRQSHVTYTSSQVYFVESRMVVRDKNQKISLFTTRICPRTRVHPK